MQKTLKISAALTALAVLGSRAAFAQTPPPPPAPPAHHGLLHNLFHRPKPGQPMPGQPMPGHMLPGRMMPGRPMMGGHMMPGRPMMGGNVIGNKNTHVYHLPGDQGALPDPKNRMYFRSAAAAEAAGYHRAGSTMGHRSMRPAMHGSPTMGTPGMRPR